MALGDPYLTLEELKGYLEVDETNTQHDDQYEDALASATRDINTHCSRQFNTDGVAAARVFHAHDPCAISVHDFHTTSGLVIKTDTAGDGTYATTWDATDYLLKPIDGIVDQEPGWPYWEIVAVGGKRFPTCCHRPWQTCTDRPQVQVTAQWGWASVPDNVKQACKIIASETAKLGDAPFGVAGFSEFGVVRIRDNPVAARKLRKFRIETAAV